ncbi:MAG: hypothetical protein ACQKBU_09930 [Verrucomicrobiales bacterium]
MSDAVTSLLQSAREDSSAPAGLAPEAHCLWLAKAGRWDAAHDLCQDLPNPAGAWIHAWLHREEGDYGNACYWYSQAGKAAPKADADLHQEWIEIAEALLNDNP